MASLFVENDSLNRFVIEVYDSSLFSQRRWVKFLKNILNVDRIFNPLAAISLIQFQDGDALTCHTFSVSIPMFNDMLPNKLISMATFWPRPNIPWDRVISKAAFSQINWSPKSNFRQFVRKCWQSPHFLNISIVMFRAAWSYPFNVLWYSGL